VSAVASIFKFFSALIVLGVLLGTAWYVLEIRKEVGVVNLDEPSLEESLESGELPDMRPGDLVFLRAVELLATGQLAEAEEKLLFIVNFYPTSNAAVESRRIVGELNLDRLLSTEHMEGKEEYVVKRGDAYHAIARRFQTTLDCIMHLNDLQRTDRLQPGDELVVMPLDLTVRIDVPRKRLSIWKSGGFVKSYPILAERGDSGIKGVLRTKLKNKSGEFGGRAYPPVALQYRDSDKVLTLADKRLFIREMPENREEELGRGFYLSEPDMEELSLVLRVGNDVEVRFPKE
jgi:LysM repeat protein